MYLNESRKTYSTCKPPEPLFKLKDNRPYKYLLHYMEVKQTMSNPDPQQSFTATLKINDKAVSTAQKILQKKIDDPRTSEELRQLHQEELKNTHNLITFSDYSMNPEESFFFAYINGVYIIKIKGRDGNYRDTLSMEGSLRNWTVHDGGAPTFFRLKNANGKSLKMTDLSESNEHEFLLYSGPQERPVCTYGDEPGLQVITDYPNRGGELATFKINITTRYTPNGH